MVKDDVEDVTHLTMSITKNDEVGAQTGLVL